MSYGGTSRKPMVVHPGSFIFKMRSRRCSVIWRL